VLDEALRHLDPPHRAVVVLHYYLGMPMPEVARAVGIPVGTAKSRLHYAVASMRANLQGDDSVASVRLAGGQSA
jgi:RNA polymerase sigma-70 factor (ECF subfamily)